MAVYETKNYGHRPSRKSIIKIMAVYETKITDHIISGPQIRFANPVRNVAANPVRKSGGCCPAVVALQYGNPPGPQIGSQIRSAMWLQIQFANPVGATQLRYTPILEPSRATNPVHKSVSQCGCKSGTQIRWVLLHRGSIPNRGQSPSHKSITQYGRLLDGYRKQSPSHKSIAQYGRPHVENSGHDPSHLSIKILTAVYNT